MSLSSLSPETARRAVLELFTLSAPALFLIPNPNLLGPKDQNEYYLLDGALVVERVRINGDPIDRLDVLLMCVEPEQFVDMVVNNYNVKIDGVDYGNVRNQVGIIGIRETGQAEIFAYSRDNKDSTGVFSAQGISDATTALAVPDGRFLQLPTDKFKFLPGFRRMQFYNPDDMTIKDQLLQAAFAPIQ